MDREPLIDLSSVRLSEEALLFLLRRDSDPVDLAALDTLARVYGPAVIRAAIGWGVPPEKVVCE